MAFSPLSTWGVTLDKFCCVCCTPAIWARSCKMLEIWSGSSEATETRNPEESCRSAVLMRFWICCKLLRKISELGLMLGVIEALVFSLESCRSAVGWLAGGMACGCGWDGFWVLLVFSVVD